LDARVFRLSRFAEGDLVKSGYAYGVMG